MSDVIAFIAGALVVAFPLTILYLRAKEDRNYFERDRDSIYKVARQLRQTLDERDLKGNSP